jgi:citrate lyase beta subunit
VSGIDTLVSALGGELDEKLAADDARLAAAYPGDRGVRQPVHTVYVPADKYAAGLPAAWGAEALSVLDQICPDGAALADVFGVADADDLLDRVREKLRTQPIEDLRIDFEDGYGSRPDGEEDAGVLAAARALAGSVQSGQATPFHGIRFKSFEAPTRDRGLRTLALFVTELADADRLTDGLLLTLPKVTSVHQVEAMALACSRLEDRLGLPHGRLGFEIQVETPQSILGDDGTVLVARMIHAADGRCTGLHYGTYDYSASCGIAAAYQSMEHPAADHAKAIMQVAAAGTGVFVSDGSTNVMPVGDPDQIRAAWRLHARLTRRSSAASTRAGTCIRPSCRVASWRRTPSIVRVCPPPPRGCVPTYTVVTPATSTSPRPPRRSRRSWLAASIAGRSRRPRCGN